MQAKQAAHELEASNQSVGVDTGGENSVGIGDARARGLQRIRFLRSGEWQYKRLAERLDSCKRSQRCKSEADPVCATLYWQKVCSALNPLLNRRSWTRALIVLSGLSKPRGQLGEIDLTAAIERFRQRLGSSALRNRVIIGAIDISLYLKNKAMIGWQLQLNLLIEGNNDPRLQEAIKAAFPAEPTAPKPYLFADVIDPEQTLARLYTTKFFRRSWYSAKKKTPMAKLPLTASDLKELLAFLGRYAVGKGSAPGWQLVCAGEMKQAFPMGADFGGTIICSFC